MRDAALWFHRRIIGPGPFDLNAAPIERTDGQLAAVRATLEAAGIEFLEGNVTARRTPPFPH
jgi:hypothetical protein